MVNNYHENHRRAWNTISHYWQKQVDKKGIWKKCHKDPTLYFKSQEIKIIGNVRSKRIAVLASGDNIAAFSFAGMGAKITSIDISEAQLKTASKRAKILGLDIRFMQSDVCNLSKIESDFFDFAYAAEGVVCWLSQLKKFYSEAARILHQDGLFLLRDGHPFMDNWSLEGTKLKMLDSYFNRGPFKYDWNAEKPNSEPLPSAEFHWTIGDHIHALLSAGLELTAFYESEDSKIVKIDPDLKVKLPTWMLLVGKKKKTTNLKKDFNIKGFKL